ncbi:MAG: UvrB/UvrC motif-containing protein [Patescibacteria group bacterium]
MDYLQKIITTLPHKPGVYQFFDANHEILYVGKAKDLKNRVTQYTRPDAVPEKTRHMLVAATTLETIQTASEFDALLLEAKLIHDLQPKYNVIAKDDKSPLYIAITLDETLPRILQLRKSQLQQALQEDLLQMASKQAIFGPFQSGRTVRDLLRHLRHSIPFCTQKRRTGTPCFYTHIGLCNPCPSVITKMTDHDARKTLVHQYRRNIIRLRDILTGKSAGILRQLDKEMYEASRHQNFEHAANVRNQLQNLRFLLEKRYDPSLYLTNTNLGERIGENQTQPLLAELHIVYPRLTRLSRVECFDISNISGTSATGSMVVAINGIMDTSQYRKFRIRLTGRPNDGAMMKEMLTRRLAHPEWPEPDCIVVDGGKPQVKEAMKVIQKTPVIGLAKRREEIIVWIDGAFQTIRLPLTNPGLQFLQRLRDEAHRFAVSYHRLLRSHQVDRFD